MDESNNIEELYQKFFDVSSLLEFALMLS